MIAITLWFQKVKSTIDALWGVTCLFCVPGVVVATIGMLLPNGGAYGGGGSRTFSVERSDLVEAAPRSYSSNVGGELVYHLGLFNRKGQLVHEYSDQLIESQLDAQHGSIVIEIPNDVPSGEYSLRVFKSGEQPVRDVPLSVGDSR